MELHAENEWRGDLAAGESTTLDVATDDATASEVVVFVDGGESDELPAQYDLIRRVDTHIRGGGARRLDYHRDVTTRAWACPAYPHRLEAELTNASDDSATFRLKLMTVVKA